ncbi:hypothetical protein [Ornithinibacillus sp. JPR2-1]|uniref:hypothetical protein n=1 Tax=Ornithinibacillus sp. JPR2-1 TaxID=2094019 RepID=UPI0031E09666
MTNQERLEKAKIEYREWVEMHDGMVPSEDLAEFEEDASQRRWLIQQAEENQEHIVNLENCGKSMAKLEIENRRYKQALEEVIETDVRVAKLIARQALEGGEESE